MSNYDVSINSGLRKQSSDSLHMTNSNLHNGTINYAITLKKLKNEEKSQKVLIDKLEFFKKHYGYDVVEYYIENDQLGRPHIHGLVTMKKSLSDREMKFLKVRGWSNDLAPVRDMDRWLKYIKKCQYIPTAEDWEDFGEYVKEQELNIEHHMDKYLDDCNKCTKNLFL